MRIAIEAQRLFRKHKHGMDIYALELIRNLQQIDKTNEYFIFVKPDEDDGVLEETDNFRIITIPGGFYPFWEQVLLPKAVKNYGCELLHCTGNTAPVFAGVPLVVTVHDIIYLEKSTLEILRGSASAYQKFGNIYRKLIVPRIIRKCAGRITVSKSEKENIDRYFGFEGNNQTIPIYNGVGSHFRRIEDQDVLSAAKKEFGLPDDFFFFLGNTDPKKNTLGTIRAFSEFTKHEKSGIKLVIADFAEEKLDKILNEIGEPGLKEKIVLTGYINNSRLPAVYSQCRLFLYPSLRESFGLPVLEAMACGVPVITSNTSSLPEVAGDAAFLINPFHIKEITEAMHFLNKDLHSRDANIGRGLMHKTKFSWDLTAREVLGIYQARAQLKSLDEIKLVPRILKASHLKRTENPLTE
ncbi:MAG: glycosyltransferase family 4 protein [Bacteroidales bacterium]|nr:glycosyltransferase family 4 protein [Bacteroidales bacterium]